MGRHEAGSSLLMIPNSDDCQLHDLQFDGMGTHDEAAAGPLARTIRKERMRIRKETT